MMPRQPTQAGIDAADELIRKSNVVRFVKEWVRDLQRLTRLKADLERIIGRPMPRQGDRASWTELAAEHDVPGGCRDWAAIAAWIVGAARRGKRDGDPQSDTAPPKPSGEWSIPMPMSELASRLNMSVPKARTALKEYSLRMVSNNRQSWTVRVDTMPANLRAKIER